MDRDERFAAHRGFDQRLVKGGRRVMSLVRRVRHRARDVLDRIAPGYMHYRRLRRVAPVERETELLFALCEPGTMAIDVGANIGLYVDHLRALGAHVVAFEPYPQMALQLRRFYRGSV